MTYHSTVEKLWFHQELPAIGAACGRWQSSNLAKSPEQRSSSEDTLAHDCRIGPTPQEWDPKHTCKDLLYLIVNVQFELGGLQGQKSHTQHEAGKFGEGRIASSCLSPSLLTVMWTLESTQRPTA